MDEVVSDKQQREAQIQRLNQMFHEKGIKDVKADMLFNDEYITIFKYNGPKNDDDLIAMTEAEKVIVVMDERIYEVMKQFGNEFGYKTLVKDWPGAGDNTPKPKNMKPMTETTRTRYELIGKKREE